MTLPGLDFPVESRVSCSVLYMLGQSIHRETLVWRILSIQLCATELRSQSECRDNRSDPSSFSFLDSSSEVVVNLTRTSWSAFLSKFVALSFSRSLFPQQTIKCRPALRLTPTKLNQKQNRIDRSFIVLKFTNKMQ